MDGLLQPAAATAFDAVASCVSLIVYLGAALAVLARRPRAVYARVFLVIALTSAVPYATTMLQWWKGSGVYTPAVIALITAAFCVGSAALFHFTQVFPWRRPWIRAHGRWLVPLYAVPVIPVALAAWTVGDLMRTMQQNAAASAASLPSDPAYVSDFAVLVGPAPVVILLASLPFFLVIGVLLPLAGVLSLVKSWQEAKAASNEPARKATFWMLISQLAGGVLAILVLPLLHFAGVPAVLSTMFAGFAYAFALVMPIALLAARVDDAAPSMPHAPPN